MKNINKNEGEKKKGKYHYLQVPVHLRGLWNGSTKCRLSENVLCVWVLHLFAQLLWKKVKQESPPAWTQEAHRPPCSECSLCWSVSWRKGVPHPVLDGGRGGTPSSPGLGGTLGYPRPDLGGGTPLSAGWGTPILILDGVPLSAEWGTPPSRPEMGYPLPHQQDGVPPVWIWDGVPSPSRPDGVPPVEVWTDKLKTVPSPHSSDAGGKILLPRDLKNHYAWACSATGSLFSKTVVCICS